MFAALLFTSQNNISAAFQWGNIVNTLVNHHPLVIVIRLIPYLAANLR